MNFNEILKKDETFRYQLLSRMKGDCDYYLGNGGRHSKYLWADNEVEHVDYMKQLWNSFGEDAKPEWLSMEQILEYEQKMGVKAVLVEMDYKGYYERFALTPEEFEKEFPETYKHFGPFNGVVNTLEKDGALSSFEHSDSDTLRPMVHIWFCSTDVGSEVWENFFTDMEWGLPESDIESGNLAYIDHNQMQSLSKYLKDTAVYHCRAVFQHDLLAIAMSEIRLQLETALPVPDYIVKNMKCVEENKAEVSEDFPDDYIFTFEFDIKMPCDSTTDIKTILDRVDGGELLDVYYERSNDKPSLDTQMKGAEIQIQKSEPRKLEKAPER